jgi:crotonobetainyl-CoA hydratase
MEEVKIVKKGRVLEILLNRPKVNAIDLATSRKLGEAFGLFRSISRTLPFLTIFTSSI